MRCPHSHARKFMPVTIVRDFCEDADGIVASIHCTAANSEKLTMFLGIVIVIS
jgi:hypothetical protein